MYNKIEFSDHEEFYSLNCFPEIIDNSDKNCFVVVILLLRATFPFNIFLETTSRNVTNEKRIHYNSTKQCVEHAEDYYKNGKHTLED